MADSEHLALLKAIPREPQYRHARLEGVKFDLREADLRGANLRQIRMLQSDFSGAQLSEATMAFSEFEQCRFDGACLDSAFLGESNFGDSTFERSSLTSAYLVGSRFHRGNFREANCQKVNASWSNFRQAIFDGADMRQAIFQQTELPYASFRGSRLHQVELMNTVLSGADLTGAVGLEGIHFRGPTVIDHETIQRSGRLPKTFLRGCGLPDEVIDFYESIPGAIYYHSCFISYSELDTDLAERLFADLQSRSVRCWFYPESQRIGTRQRSAITEAIHVHDKLLLLLSQHSIQSAWVESEVETAFERERRERRDILFPVMLDDAVLTSDTPWAMEVRRRHIGDFKSWRDQYHYTVAFDRLLRDLKAR